MIYKLFDVTSASERHHLIHRSAIVPIPLMGGKIRSMIERQMRAKFIEFDVDQDNLLNPIEFAKCISDTNLCLSAAEIEILRIKADLNKDGYIDIQEFIQFAYDSLLQLARDVSRCLMKSRCIIDCHSLVFCSVLLCAMFRLL